MQPGPNVHSSTLFAPGSAEPPKDDTPKEEMLAALLGYALLAQQKIADTLALSPLPFQGVFQGSHSYFRTPRNTRLSLPLRDEIARGGGAAVRMLLSNANFIFSHLSCPPHAVPRARTSRSAHEGAAGRGRECAAGNGSPHGVSSSRIFSSRICRQLDASQPREELLKSVLNANVSDKSGKSAHPANHPANHPPGRNFGRSSHVFGKTSARGAQFASELFGAATERLSAATERLGAATGAATERLVGGGRGFALADDGCARLAALLARLAQQTEQLLVVHSLCWEAAGETGIDSGRHPWPVLQGNTTQFPHI